MAKNSFNLALRFILEMTTLFATAFWGWKQLEGWKGLMLAFFIPLSIAITWAVFATPGDPSRSGKTVVNTPGWLRLIFEICVFGFGVWAFFDLGFFAIAYLFSGAIIVHYLFSVNRIKWLFNQ